MITNAIHKLRAIYESTKDEKIADLESRLVKAEYEKNKSDLLRSHYDTTKELANYKRNSAYHQGSDPFGKDQGKNNNQNNQGKNNQNNNQGNKNNQGNNQNNNQGKNNNNNKNNQGNRNNNQGKNNQGNKNNHKNQVKRRKP